MSHLSAASAEPNGAVVAGRQCLLRLTLSPDEQDELWELGRDIERLGGVLTEDGYLFRSPGWRDAAAEYLADLWDARYFVSVNREGIVTSGEDSATQPTRAPRLIIAACESDDSRALADFFVRQGFAVKSALDGLDCLELLRMQRPQVLVMDQQLPWGGGDGVVARLREDLQSLAIPVVLIGNAPRCSISVEPPIAEYLLKPVEPHELLDTLQRALEGSPTRV